MRPGYPTDEALGSFSTLSGARDVTQARQRRHDETDWASRGGCADYGCWVLPR
jgi:hypothetical protein